MSAPIGPGDWVECVDASPSAFSELRPFVRLELGRVYVVTDIVIASGPDGDLGPALVLDAPETRSRSPQGPDGWAPERFRPIYRRDEGLIQRLLQPLPAEPDLVSA